jgi:hypothetical protein
MQAMRRRAVGASGRSSTAWPGSEAAHVNVDAVAVATASSAVLWAVLSFAASVGAAVAVPAFEAVLSALHHQIYSSNKHAVAVA